MSRVQSGGVFETFLFMKITNNNWLKQTMKPVRLFLAAVKAWTGASASLQFFLAELTDQKRTFFWPSANC